MKIDMPLTIRYAETDMMGVVHHASYALYLEDARTDFLVKLGFPYTLMEERGFMSPVVDLNCHYIAPLAYGDAPVIRTWVNVCRPSLTGFKYQVFKNAEDLAAEKPCFTATSTHCAVDAKTFRPVSIKRCLPELWDAYCRVLEED